MTPYEKCIFIENEATEINEEVDFLKNALKANPALAPTISKKLSLLEKKMLKVLSKMVSLEKEIA